jgi:Domain of unknown function (DUF222)
MTNPAQSLRDSAHAVARLGQCGADFEALDDDALLAAQRVVSEHRRHLDTYATWIAGQIAHRSRRELGYTGLAQRTGFVSPEALVQSVTGSTRAEASKYVRVGVMVAEATAPTESGPSWLSPVARAVESGNLSADAAESIRRGLGTPSEGVLESALEAAAVALLLVQADADQLFRRARQLRDELDAAGVATREADRRSLRYLKIGTRPDGMVSGSFLLDPEDGGMLVAAIDAATSPRRGGPRFVDPYARESVLESPADTRTIEQVAVDTLVELVRVAVDANPTRMPGVRPAVRVIVTADNLRDRVGFGRWEGSHEPVALDSVDRLACDAGTIDISFDRQGQVLNLGRAQRLFSPAQRIALAVRDGGCRFPGCDRPPSWTEAHHINQWHRDRGRTDLADGILLCRRHHLLIHNNHWRIHRGDGTYWLTPPKSIDAGQKPIELPSRTPEVAAMRHGAVGHVAVAGAG